MAKAKLGTMENPWKLKTPPGTSDYGRLSVMLQVDFRIERLFVVPPGAFRPEA